VAQVFSVAKEFVRLSLLGDEKDPLTNLRLQQLLYYAQAWSLVLREAELFSDDLQAWRWGPVVPAVYHQLPDGQGANVLSEKAFADVPDVQGDEAEFVKCVWEAYNGYSALQLSRMTREEPPWRKAWESRPGDGGGDGPISIDDLEDYFGRQAVPAPLAAYYHNRRKKEQEAERSLAGLAPLDPARLQSAATSFTPAARRLAGAGG
jgi:uncharacterized phage-associated protein